MRVLEAAKYTRLVYRPPGCLWLVWHANVSEWKHTHTHMLVYRLGSIVILFTEVLTYVFVNYNWYFLFRDKVWICLEHRQLVMNSLPSLCVDNTITSKQCNRSFMEKIYVCFRFKWHCQFKHHSYVQSECLCIDTTFSAKKSLSIIWGIS